MFVKMIAGAAVVIACASAASAASFDFESVPLGTYSTLNVSDGALALTVTTEGYPGGFVNVLNPGLAALGQVSVIGMKTSSFNIGNFAPLRFAFNQTISSITFTYGDGGGDSDSPVLVQAYTAGGVLLGSETGSFEANFVGVRNLTLSFAGASYFIASSGSDIDNENSLLWDVSNVVAGSAAPEPASWALMMIGFGAIGGALRSRRKVSLTFA